MFTIKLEINFMQAIQRADQVKPIYCKHDGNGTKKKSTATKKFSAVCQNLSQILLHFDASN